MKIGCKSPLISRLAPTPSGYLHVGNGVNFVLTFLLVKKYNGILHLRIDDIDTQRLKIEYIDNIFASLEWLGIRWDEGAKNPSDYYQNYHFSKREKTYKKEFEKISPFTYPCECSRKQIKLLSKNGLYPQTCLRKSFSYDPQKHSLRLHVRENTSINVENKLIFLDQKVGDLILWRKGDLPSYNFASLVDDKNLKTSLIVRGKDLLLSSALQLYMAKLLGWEDFLHARFIHHDLCLDANGSKLSKSTKSPPLLNEKSKKFIYKKVANILKLPTGAEDNISTLKEAFKI